MNKGVLGALHLQLRTIFNFYLPTDHMHSQLLITSNMRIARFVAAAPALVANSSAWTQDRSGIWVAIGNWHVTSATSVLA